MNEFVVGGRGQTVETRGEADQVVAEAVAELKEAGVEATGSCRPGQLLHCGHHIVERADQFSADVIVVGSRRRRSRWGGLRGQGVRERITELTSLPVMTAPPPLRLGVSGAPRRRNLRSLAHRSAPANSPGLLISGVDADS
jgi:nucleotide-binding universal stress UspA family protein